MHDSIQTLQAGSVMLEPGSITAGRDRDQTFKCSMQGQSIRSTQWTSGAPCDDVNDAWKHSEFPIHDRVVIPALSNAHDHARHLRASSLGAWGQPLESWLPFWGTVPGVDPYLAACAAFARSLRGGVTSVMVHYTRTQGTCDYIQEALAVARAARDVGIRIGFAVAMRNRHHLAYGSDLLALKSLRPSIQEEVKRRLLVEPVATLELIETVRAVAQAIGSDPTLAPHVCVQYGPTGVQWCSDELLKAIAQASHDDQRPVHMHLLETPYQRAWADRQYPLGIVRHLDDLGLLNARLTLAHCTWLRPGEMDLLAQRGVTISINTSSNLHLRSGIASVAEMHRAGCQLAMGLDGTALDEDDDALREWRLLSMLHSGWGFETTIDESSLWKMATQHGRHAILGQAQAQQLPGGRLASGHAADMIVLDRSTLDDDDAIVPGVNLWQIIKARGNAKHIHSVISMGKLALSNQQVMGIDETESKKEFMAQMRSAMSTDPSWTAWHQTIQCMAEDLKAHYQGNEWLGCC
jgi:cytosine/adenosine deaminase-related metal-dependent hydrolase